MAELSVEEAQVLARQFLNGTAGEAEMARLRSELEHDETAALELLAQMETALEDVAPSGLNAAQSASVAAKVEALIKPHIRSQGLVGLFKKILGVKPKPLFAPHPAAEAAPSRSGAAEAPSAPAQEAAKAKALKAPEASASGKKASDRAREKGAQAGPAEARAALNPPAPASLAAAAIPAGGEDEVMPGPPPLRGLGSSGAASQALPDLPSPAGQSAKSVHRIPAFQGPPALRTQAPAAPPIVPPALGTPTASRPDPAGGLDALFAPPVPAPSPAFEDAVLAKAAPAPLPRAALEAVLGPETPAPGPEPVVVLDQEKRWKAVEEASGAYLFRRALKWAALALTAAVLGVALLRGLGNLKVFSSYLGKAVEAPGPAASSVSGPASLAKATGVSAGPGAGPSAAAPASALTANPNPSGPEARGASAPGALVRAGVTPPPKAAVPASSPALQSDLVSAGHAKGSAYAGPGGALSRDPPPPPRLDQPLPAEIPAATPVSGGSLN